MEDPTTPPSASPYEMLAWIERYGGPQAFVKDEMDEIKARMQEAIGKIRAHKRCLDIERRYNRGERLRLFEIVNMYLRDIHRRATGALPAEAVEIITLAILSMYARVGVDPEKFYQHGYDFQYLSLSLRNTNNIICDDRTYRETYPEYWSSAIIGHMCDLAKNLCRELDAAKPKDILVMLCAPRALKMWHIDLAQLPSELVRHVGEMLFG